jgi:hypothetical protein
VRQIQEFEVKEALKGMNEERQWALISPIELWRGLRDIAIV